MNKSIAHRWGSFFRATLDLIYPRQCQICGETRWCENFSFLCNDCFRSAIPIQPPCCESCGLPFQGKIQEPFLCPNCSDMKLYFDRAIAIVRFQGVVRRAIHGFKYSHQSYWLKVLHTWFIQGADDLLQPETFDLIIPVPLHTLRERERGFNQSWQLIQPLAEKWALASDRNGLVRVRETVTQTNLDRQERLQNLKGAFQVSNPENIQGKRILLVDDVLTTGATANECARALSQAGATSVLVFTLARGY
jgi:competence protein ComFC